MKKLVLASPSMVHGLFARRKTQMCTPLNPQPKYKAVWDSDLGELIEGDTRTEIISHKPRHNIDDVLCVRETGHPSDYVPREAERLYLRVANVCCERVQNITVEDVIAEGITADLSNWNRIAAQHKKTFSELWDSRYDETPNAWENNPWVWVYEFEKFEAAKDDKL